MASLLRVEINRSEDIVRPAGKKAKAYMEWFMDEVSKGSDPEEVMQLVIQHTQNWGVSQGILAELSRFEEVEEHFKRKYGGILGKKQLPEHVKQHLEMVKAIFLSELLNEIFIKDTNFVEVKYGA